jgi:hypothetical protein
MMASPRAVVSRVARAYGLVLTALSILCLVKVGLSLLAYLLTGHPPPWETR